MICGNNILHKNIECVIIVHEHYSRLWNIIYYFKNYVSMASDKIYNLCVSVFCTLECSCTGYACMNNIYIYTYMYIHIWGSIKNIPNKYHQPQFNFIEALVLDTIMFMVNPTYVAQTYPTGSCSSHFCHLAEGMWIIFPQNGNNEQAYGKKKIILLILNSAMSQIFPVWQWLL
jgi:hypothetical protein